MSWVLGFLALLLVSVLANLLVRCGLFCWENPEKNLRDYFKYFAKKRKDYAKEKLFAGSDESVARPTAENANENVGGIASRNFKPHGVGNPVVVSKDAFGESAADTTQSKTGGAGRGREDTSSGPASPRPKADAPLKERLAYWEDKI